MSPSRDVALPPPVKCRAHNRDGSPCSAYAMRAGVVCRMHGGAAGQTRRKAQERLEAASDRLARALLDIAASADSESVRLAAIRDALDRVGVTSKTAIEVEVQAPWQIMLSRMVVSSSAVTTNDDVVDAELVIEDDDDGPITPPSPSELNDDPKPSKPRQATVYVPESHFDSTPPARLDPGRASRRGRTRFTR